ncbi:MAG: ferrous iron transport protein A [Robiginitomaculum sp.]|nr:ferrous iron transport protein A [Robiginitomaculum sp.]
MSCISDLPDIMTTQTLTLDQLPAKKLGHIHGFVSANSSLALKLREIGFAEGDEIEVLHRGPVGGTPLSVRLNTSLIALRKSEAAQIQVVIAK